MTPEDLKNRFLLHGVKCSVVRDEVRLQVCVFCGNTKYNLEANPVLGLYHCWTCGAGGRVDTLVKEVTGVTVHVPVTKVDLRDRPRTSLPADVEGEPVAENPYLAEYLKTRRITTVDMAVYQIRSWSRSQWENRVVFPLLDYWDRRLVGYIGRTIIGERPKYLSVWNQDRRVVVGYRSRSTVHVVVEGVLDGIRVHKAGFNAAVLSGTRIPDLEFWAARVPPGHTVVVMLDGDAKYESDHLYSTVLPIHPRTIKIPLPEGLDPASLFEPSIKLLVNHYLEGDPCL